MSPKSPCAGVWAPLELSYFTATMSGILSVITTGGNFLVILAVIKDPFKKLRTPFMYFLVSLAVSDLLVGCVTMPVSIVTHTLEAHRTKKLIHVRIIQLSYFISANASMLNLGALCLDRYFAVAHPMKYRRRMTLSKCLLVSLFIWILAFSLPMLFFKIGYINYLMTFAHTGVILTLVILIFTYFKVYRTLKLQTKKLKTRLKKYRSKEEGKVELETALQNGQNDDDRDNQTLESNTMLQKKENNPESDCETEEIKGNSEAKDDNDNKKELSLSKNEKKVTKAFLTILILFAFCYIPVITMIYILRFCPSCDCVFRHILRDLQFLFAISNSTVNPFVCTIRLKPFRQALTMILKIRKTDTDRSRSNTQSESSSRKLTLSSYDQHSINLTKYAAVTPN